MIQTARNVNLYKNIVDNSPSVFYTAEDGGVECFAAEQEQGQEEMRICIISVRNRRKIM